LQQYRPEQLLLPAYEERGPEWKAFLNDYEAVAFEDELALLVKKTMVRPPQGLEAPPSTSARQQSPGF